MSAEPKPEKPRTTPASTAAPTAAANSAEKTSRLAPPTCTTAGHRRTPGGSADETRDQRGAAGAAAGGEAAAPGLRRLTDLQVPRGALDLGGAGGGEVVVEDARVHAFHGELRRPRAHRADGASLRAGPLRCDRPPLRRDCGARRPAPGTDAASERDRRADGRPLRLTPNVRRGRASRRARRVPRRRESRSAAARRLGVSPRPSAPPRRPRRGCVPPPRPRRPPFPAAGDGGAR